MIDKKSWDFKLEITNRNVAYFLKTTVFIYHFNILMLLKKITSFPFQLKISCYCSFKKTLSENSLRMYNNMHFCRKLFLSDMSIHLDLKLSGPLELMLKNKYKKK